MRWLTRKRLKSKEASKRREAAQRLGRSHNVRAVQPLIDALRDSDATVRRAAAEALGQLQDFHATSALLTALNDPEPTVARAAAHAIAAIGDPASVDGLIQALLSAPNHVQWAIEPTLAKINPNWASSPAAKNTMPSHLRRLEDPDEYVRQSSAGVLESIGDARAFDAFIKAAGDRNPYVRALAVRILGKIGDRRAVDALAHALEDESHSVREDAARALGKIGDARATPSLVAALGSVREAIAALGLVGDAACVMPLIRYLPEHRSDVKFHNNASDADDEQRELHDIVRAVSAVLHRNAAALPIAELQTIAGLEDHVRYRTSSWDTPGYGKGDSLRTIKADLSTLRQCATQELARRETKK